MAFSTLKVALFLMCMILICVRAQVNRASFHLGSTESFEWPWSMAMYDELDEQEDQDGEFVRRSLYGKVKHYYISYGALSANRIPCPARSGRSYYTHNCYRAGGQVNPYVRGCSTITRCRR